MNKHACTLILCFLLNGCSVLGKLTIFNNTSHEVEACNLNMRSPTCQSIRPGSLAVIYLNAEIQAPSWRLSIGQHPEAKIYNFNFEAYKDLSSEIYCSGTFFKSCSIPLQYESSGFVYWVGKNAEMPISNFPAQPIGFPIVPSSE